MAQKIVSRQKHNMLSLLHAACLKLLVFSFNKCAMQHIYLPGFLCSFFDFVYHLHFLSLHLVRDCCAFFQTFVYSALSATPSFHRSVSINPFNILSHSSIFAMPYGPTFYPSTVSCLSVYHFPCQFRKVA